MKLDPGCGRNVKSNVESDVDLSCSAVIFQQGLNSLLGPQSNSACAQKKKCHLSSFLKDSHTTSSPNGKIVFLVCHFLFPPLSSPCPTLSIFREAGRREKRADVLAHKEFELTLYLFSPCLAPTLTFMRGRPHSQIFGLWVE